MQRNLESGISGTVKTHVTPFGSFANRNHTGRRHKVILRVFRIDTTFDSRSAELDIILFVRQRISGGNSYHIAHQVNPRALFRHRMFHLQAGIHFQEVEVLVFVHHKLQRPGTIITDSLASFHRHFQHLLPSLFLHKRRRTFLYHLLVTTLDRTFTFVQMDYIPILISHYLHLDMVRILYVLFNINGIIAKRRSRFGLGQAESRFHFLFGTYQAHPLSPATSKRFQHNGITYLIGYFLYFINTLHRRFRSGHNRQSGFTHNLARFRLDSHLGNNIRTRADKNHSFFFTTTGKIRIFRQETVSRMNGRPCLFGDSQYQFRFQIGSIFGRFGNAISLFRIADVQSSTVNMCINSHRRDIHHPACAEDTHRYFTPVGY